MDSSIALSAFALPEFSFWGFEHEQPKKSCRTGQQGALLQGRSEEQRVTEVQRGAQVTACWGTTRCATQPSTFLGTSWKKSRAELCFLRGKKKKRERKNPSRRLRPCKQQHGASDSEVGATIRSQPHPGCYQTCYGDNVDHLPHTAALLHWPPLPCLISFFIPEASVSRQRKS